jgi:hypothetical protein
MSGKCNLTHIPHTVAGSIAITSEVDIANSLTTYFTSVLISVKDCHYILPPNQRAKQTSSSVGKLSQHIPSSDGVHYLDALSPSTHRHGNSTAHIQLYTVIEPLPTCLKRRYSYPHPETQ